MVSSVRKGMSRREFVKTVGMTASATAMTYGSRGLLSHARAQSAAASVGINLAGIADWNTELPFVDVFRMSRPWISQREGAAFAGGPELALDRFGYVQSLEPSCWAESFLCGVERTPPGLWTVLYEGTGTLEMKGQGVELQRAAAGRLDFNVQEGAGYGFVLQLLDVDPADPVRNIRVLMPGTLETYQTDPWNPSFLERWQGMASLRLMDFMETNNSTIASWDDRPQREHATYCGRGVPVELLVDLSNRLGIDPWFCMPHMASDDYVLNFASYVRDNLRPELKPYVEYSNEVWNNIFEQHRYAVAQGMALGYADSEYEAALRFCSTRAVQVFRLWQSAYRDSARFTRVLAAQAAVPYTSDQLLSWQNAAAEADCIAVAPYMSFNVTPDLAPEVATLSLDQLFARLHEGPLAEATGWMRGTKEVADRHGVKLIAYEGGQHLCAIWGVENDEAVTSLLVEANADPRMGELYRAYHAAWSDAGGQLFCHFSSVSEWSKWGSWGLLRQYDENPADSPKFVEVMRWANEQGQTVSSTVQALL
jgi:hypothetical protein